MGESMAVWPSKGKRVNAIIMNLMRVSDRE